MINRDRSNKILNKNLEIGMKNSRKVYVVWCWSYCTYCKLQMKLLSRRRDANKKFRMLACASENKNRIKKVWLIYWTLPVSMKWENTNYPPLECLKNVFDLSRYSEQLSRECKCNAKRAKRNKGKMDKRKIGINRDCINSEGNQKTSV